MFYENPIKLRPSVSHFHLCWALSQLFCCMPSSYSSLTHSVRLQLTVLFCCLVGGEWRQSPSCLHTRSAGYQKQASLGSGGKLISMSQISKGELLVVITHTNRHWMPFPERTDKNEMNTQWKKKQHCTAVHFGNPHQWNSSLSCTTWQRPLQTLQSNVPGELESVIRVLPRPSFSEGNSFFPYLSLNR